MRHIHRKSRALFQVAVAVLCSYLISPTQRLDARQVQTPTGTTDSVQQDKSVTSNIRLLKVQIVISRYEPLSEAARKSGTAPKKLSSEPYELLVTPGQPAVSLRMGTQLPVPKDGSYQYMSVGTNIDCEARPGANDSFRLDLTIEDTALKDRQTTPNPTFVPAGVPTIQTFRTHNVLVMRPGESNQLTAVDKVTGETIKVDITLSRADK
jgi:hypothetical protein